ncbi:MAG: response regulator transcription factor [Bacteroidia bacterium]|nr:response regulator transcription factor [Bacteroidia bacterium]
MPALNPVARILYVEDDPTLGFITQENLEEEGFAVVREPDGRQALEVFRRGGFDICVLDIMLPSMDGFQLAQAIRTLNREIPILFLSARTLQEDRLKGLKLGADDYLVKPFSLEELVLKLHVFLKRAKLVKPDEGPDDYTLGDYTFNYPQLSLTHATEGERQLTLREASLLRYFAKHLGELLAREAILTEIWGTDDYFAGRSLDVFISRLRKYLKADARIKIENVHGYGFKLVVE